jgi:hypothetical protein
MTVKELIERLKTMPEDMDVLASDEHTGPYTIERAIKSHYMGKDVIIVDWEKEQ